jgi:Fic family protein
LIREIHKRLVEGVRGDEGGRVRIVYKAIQTVREQDMDLTGWLDFFVGGLATQLEEVKSRGEMVIRRDVIAREHGLNERQSLIVEKLLEQSELQIEDVEALCPDVNRRTLQRDLQGLVEVGVLKSTGAARSVRYRMKIKGL